MDYNINFPRLGIFLKHVGKQIDIHGFEIAFYGICISIAMIVGFLLVTNEAKRTNQNVDDYCNMGIIGIICAIIGARLYYVIFRWNEYKDDLVSIINIRQGGLAIYGGIIAAALVIIFYAKKKKLNTLRIMDTVSTSILIGQAIGRWGNFFNREVFGKYTKSLLAMEIPINAVNDSADITSQMMKHKVIRDGIEYISVHPTFLYESLWNLGLFAILMIYRKHKKFEGELVLLYLFGYGIGRFWIEGIRTDQLFIIGTHIPVSQVLSGILVIASLICLFYMKKRTEVKCS